MSVWLGIMVGKASPPRALAASEEQEEDLDMVAGSLAAAFSNGQSVVTRCKSRRLRSGKL